MIVNWALAATYSYFIRDDTTQYVGDYHGFYLHPLRDFPLTSLTNQYDGMTEGFCNTAQMLGDGDDCFLSGMMKVFDWFSSHTTILKSKVLFIFLIHGGYHCYCYVYIVVITIFNIISMVLPWITILSYIFI